MQFALCSMCSQSCHILKLTREWEFHIWNVWARWALARYWDKTWEDIVDLTQTSRWAWLLELLIMTACVLCASLQSSIYRAHKQNTLVFDYYWLRFFEEGCYQSWSLYWFGIWMITIFLCISHYLVMILDFLSHLFRAHNSLIIGGYHFPFYTKLLPS